MQYFYGLLGELLSFVYAPPTISGVAKVGSTLTLTHGNYTNAPTSYAVQWYRSGVKISGATSLTYVCVTADIGSVITASETPSNAVGAGVIAFTLPTVPVAVATGAPVNVTPPSISGSFLAGHVLTASGDTWTNTPTSKTYMWYLNGQPITVAESGGSVTSTYTVQAWDVLGLPLTVAVQAINASGTSAPAFSNSVTGTMHYTFSAQQGAFGLTGGAGSPLKSQKFYLADGFSCLELYAAANTFTLAGVPGAFSEAGHALTPKVHRFFLES